MKELSFKWIVKKLKKLTNIDDLKIDALDINTKIIIDKNNLNFET